MKLWGGRFEKEINKIADDFCKSIYFDIELAEYDIQVNLAYANALQKANILTGDELEQIKKALRQIKEEIENKEFKIIDSDEDIHTAIERSIVEKTGETGKKIHTGRSRNEQVAADERLYLKEQIKDITKIIKEVQKTIIEKSKENIDVLMPGYTHFQPAQPILFSHYLLAYFWALQRDIERLIDSKKRVDISPLGSGALSGNSLNIDRGFLAEKLGFNSITKNSIDAVSDRDFIFEFLSISSLILIHISRLAEEIIIWSNPNFDFIELDDSYTTGSSLMPQKKNPDVAELIRAKTGRVTGNLVSLAVVLKGLPLSYNRDLQEDKEPLFDSVKTLKDALVLSERLLATMKIKSKNMKSALKDGFIIATDVADYLVLKGVSFLEAHTITGVITKYCLLEKKTLGELSIEEWKKHSDLFESDIVEFISYESSIARKNVEGGTSKESVLGQIKKAEELMI